VTRTLLVLGAGYVGAHAATTFAAVGHQVVAVRRRGADGDTTPGITWIAGDARDPDSIHGLPSRVDAVLLTAAPTSHRGDDHADTYPPLARAAVKLAQRLGAATVAYTSSTGVYGRTDGAWVPEDTPRAPRSADTRALVEAEDVLLSATDVRPAVLRVAGIYGPGRPAMSRFLDPTRLAAHGEYFTNFAHRDDIVAALDTVIARDDAPPVLNCADGAALQALEVARVACALTHTPWPNPLVFVGEATPPRSNQRVPNDRLMALGWAPRYPSVREGFAALVATGEMGTRTARP
jgi:nucleoside-diphosphate-sugar epimerase